MMIRKEYTINDTREKEKIKEALNSLHIIGQLMVSILIVYYTWYNEKYHHNTVIVYGAFAILAVCVLLDMFLNRSIDYKQFHIGIWINFAIAIYAILIGMLIAYNKEALVESAKLVLQYSFIAFSSYYLALSSKHKMDWILITINISALICCYFLFRNPYSQITGRYSMSSRNNPNTLGVVLVMGIFSIMYRIKPKLKSIIFGLAQTGVLLYGIIMTGSRKSLIAAMIVLALSSWDIMKEAKNKLNQYQFWGMVIVCVVAIAIGSKYILDYYFNSRISQRMQTMVESQNEDANRILFYQKAWEFFQEKPLFGGGLDQFKFWAGTGGYAHSTYAEAIADFGFIGCVLYFFPILYSGKQIIRKVFTKHGCHAYVVLSLYLAELFLGIGQVFFIDIIHYFAWTIIYFETNEQTEKEQIGMEYKYIKA